MFINVDASGGSVRVEVLDRRGRPIPGFAADQVEPIMGDQLRAKVAWAFGVDVRGLCGRRVKVRLLLENARLYSISVLGPA